MNIYGIGTLFPEYFNDGTDYFSAFNASHTTQFLSESDKGDVAYRKGIYLTEVTRDGHFKLLRCSSNLRGPTDNFSDIDRAIVSKANSTAKDLFRDPAKLNHVLAQVYHNYRIDGRERRAKIAKHSDKTKDMATNGIMVFCTFYDKKDLSKKIYKKDPDDEHNLLYKNTTALTILRFVSKDEKEIRQTFDVLLYPNSAFFMDLETNRLFTHEIVPPNLDSTCIPTRLGYVIRCSQQEARFDRETLIKRPDGKWEPLQPPTPEGIARLKELYRMENATTEKPEYGYVNFSLNDGDYLKPNRSSYSPNPVSAQHQDLIDREKLELSDFDIEAQTSDGSSLIESRRDDRATIITATDVDTTAVSDII